MPWPESRWRRYLILAIVCVLQCHTNIMQDYVYMAWALGTKSRQGLSSVLQLSLIQDKVEMLKQLKTLEREDRTHRQKMLGAMPVSG